MENKQKDVKIFLATPMYGGLCYGHFMGSVLTLQTLLLSKGWSLNFGITVNEALIARARNSLVEEFLHGSAADCTHMLFLDADIIFDPQSIVDLIEFDKDVVCAAYPKKIIDWNKIKPALNEHPEAKADDIPILIREVCVNTIGAEPDADAKGLIEVKHAGTGCMLIKRKVFEKMLPHTQHAVDRGRDGLAPPKSVPLFFDCSIEPESGVYLSEDYHFCKCWRDIGGKVHLAYNIYLRHVGTHIFG